MIRCYITDRHKLPPGESLPEAIARSIAAGVDWIQIREKDLPARELLPLARPVTGVRIIVNSRVDVALAAGSAGAHLPAGSPPPRVWRALTPPGFLIGVSCHDVEQVRAAEAEGADYVLFGPIYPPLSKSSDLDARGLGELARAASAVRIPVIALGGITPARIAACLDAGAAGIAGISIFQTMDVRI